MKVLEDGTVTMTFSEYDSHVEDAQECGYRLSATWYPSMETAMRIMEDFAHNVRNLAFRIQPFGDFNSEAARSEQVPPARDA